MAIRAVFILGVNIRPGSTPEEVGIVVDFTGKINDYYQVFSLNLPLDLIALAHNKKAAKEALEAQFRDYLISLNVVTFADDDTVELLGF